MKKYFLLGLLSFLIFNIILKSIKYKLYKHILNNPILVITEIVAHTVYDYRVLLRSCICYFISVYIEWIKFMNITAKYLEDWYFNDSRIILPTASEAWNYCVDSVTKIYKCYI
jgi:hypothetical protein